MKQPREMRTTPSRRKRVAARTERKSVLAPVVFGPSPIVGAEDAVKIARVSKAVSLLEVRLVDLRSRRSLRGEPDGASPAATPPPELKLDAGGVHELDADLMRVWIQLTAKTKPKFEIEAVYELVYRVVGAVANDDAEAFARVNGLFNVWPYWRELVQTLTQRMEERAPVVPLLRI